MKVILGLTTSHHDGAASLIINGKLKGAISKERITRVKKDGNGNDKKLILHLLKQFDLTINDIDCVAFCDDPQYNFKNYEPYIKFYKNKKEVLPENADNMTCNHYELEAEIEGKKIPAYQIHHQLSHCAYSFFTSNKEKAICLSMDASGPTPHTCSILAKGNKNKIEIIKCPNLQVGNMYNCFTTYIGLGSGLFKAGSLMGLASYGTPNDVAKKNWEKYKKYDENEKEFMPEQRTGYDYEKTWLDLTGGIQNNYDRNFFLNDSPKAMELAASTQYIFEKIILDEVNKIYDEQKEHHDDTICLSGGSFLNCNVNSLIKLETRFEKVHISPACGDDGLSAGAALYVNHHIQGNPQQQYSPKEIMYLGGKYEASSKIGKPYNPKEVAKLISDGKVVAWFQGRSEFGPRALGNRSLLADPRNKKMRDHLNFKVKHREWFRPYAPSVLAEKSQEWFDFDEDGPYMLFTMNVKQPEKVPAITHIDGTARIQTIRQEDNPKYYELIKEFENITGVPMILNTSLNGHEEPILETPEDAYNFLKNANCDLLVIENKIITKRDINDTQFF